MWTLGRDENLRAGGLAAFAAWLFGNGPRQCASEEPRAGTALPRSRRQGDPTWITRAVQSFLQMACFSPGPQYKMPHCLGGAADVWGLTLHILKSRKDWEPVPYPKDRRSTVAPKSCMPCHGMLHTCLIQDATNVKGPFGCINRPWPLDLVCLEEESHGWEDAHKPSLKAEVNARRFECWCWLT